MSEMHITKNFGKKRMIWKNLSGIFTNKKSKQIKRILIYLFISFLLLLIADLLWSVMMETNTMGSSCSASRWKHRYIIDGKVFQWFLEDGYPCLYSLTSFMGFYLYFTMFYLLYKATGDKLFGGKSRRRDISEVTLLLLIYWGGLLSEIRSHVSSLPSEALIYSFAGSLSVIWPLYVLGAWRHFFIGLKLNSFLKGLLLFVSSYLFIIIAVIATLLLFPG